MSSTRRNAVKSLAKRRKLERVLTSIAALAVVPGACAALGAFTPDLDKVYGTDVVVAIWGALLLILAALAIRLNPTGESFLELAVENEEQEEQIALLLESEQELSSIVDRLAFETAYALSVRSAILAFARQGVRTSEDLEKVLHDLASPLHLQGEFIFGLGPGEAWSFAIYLYSAEADLLVPIWRRKSQNHRSSGKGLGREWGRGEGHVGKAFVDQRTIVTGDAQHPDAEPFSSVPTGKERTYDATAYRSFASVPIGPLLAEDLRPYGVLVATSDRVGRFGRENSGILEQIAGAVASFLITGGLDIDRVRSSKPS